jgi:RHS repeat-associated protein
MPLYRVTAASRLKTLGTLIYPLLSIISFITFPSVSTASTDQFKSSFTEDIPNSQIISMRAPSPQGDSYDPVSGNVSFAVTDISIPGNSGIPVELSRFFSTDYIAPGGLAWIGKWRLDIPTISAYYVKRGNGQVNISGDGWHNGKVCTGDVANFITASSYMGQGTEIVTFDSYWQGKLLHIPHETSEPFLAGVGEFIGKQITKSNYYVSSCFQRPDGNGEGFVVSGPDGKKFTFAHSIDEEARNSPSNAYRYKKTMLVTKVEDRFGNYVNYNYSGKELKSIISSDGRTIHLNFNPATKVATVTAGSRSWIYKFDSSSQLIEVQLPDSRKWQYSTNFYKQSRPATHVYNSVTVPSGYCDKQDYNSPTPLRAPISFTVTTPDNAVINYTVTDIYHGRAQTPSFSLPSYRNRMLDMYNCTIRQNLVKKMISGPGITLQTWEYSYSENRGTYGSNSTPGMDVNLSFPKPQSFKNLSDVKTTTIKGPNSTEIYYVDRRANAISEDSILAIDTADSGKNSLLRREERNYAESGASLRVGSMTNLTGRQLNTDEVNKLLRRSNGIRKEHRLTLNKAITSIYAVDGVDIYNTEYLSSDIYGFPTKVKEFNNFSNNVRYQSFEYLHDSSTSWVIGLPLATRVSSDGNSWTTTINNTYYPSYQGGGYQLQLKDQFSYGQRTKTFSQYHSDGQIKRVEFPGTNRWTELLDYKRGQAQTYRIPQSHSTAIQTAYKTIDDNGWLRDYTDFNGATIYYDYDAGGDLISITPRNPKWAPTRIVYERATSADMAVSGISAGMLVQRITRGNHSKNIYYNALLQPLVESEQDLSNSGTLRFTIRRFDANGNKTFESYPSANPNENKGITFQFDALDRNIRTTQDTQSGSTSAQNRYLSKNKLEHSDFKNNKTITSYLVFGNPTNQLATEIVSPETVTTSIKYNLFGNPVSITQGGITQHNVYDSAQRLCKQIRPDIGNISYSYNNANELAWSAHSTSVDSLINSCDHTVDNDDKVGRTYDNHGNIRSQTFGDGTQSKTFTYDRNGNLTRLDFGGTVQQYAYDDANNLISESTTVDGQVRNVSYQFNSGGHISAITYPNNHRVEFNPNALGQATLVRNTTVATTYASNITYHPSGALNGFTYGNGLRYNLTQNQQRLPQVISLRNASNTSLLAGFTYTYDNNLNISSITDNHVAAYSINMTYDGLNRLKTANSNWGSGIYNYDTLGNIQNYSLGSFSLNYSYNANKQLTSVSGSKSYSFTYDERGNVTKNTATGNTFNYNLANQMARIGNNNYVYDGHNRRVKKQNPAGAEYFTYAKTGTLLHNQKANGIKQNYIYLGNSVIAKVDATANTISYVHTDHLGSVVAESNTSGQITKRFHYKPFGETIETQQDDIGYTGHKHDSDLGLTYMQARYYDPVLGRFYANDPVGYVAKNPVHSFSRYTYVNNNPYKYTDPNGEFAHIAIGAAAGGIISGIAYAITTDNFSAKDLAINMASGAVVGAVTAAVPGAIAAGSLNFGGKIANGAVSVGNAAAAGAVGSVGTELATTGKIDAGKALVAGAANATGLLAGNALTKPASAIATVKTVGNPGLPVTSLKGNTFMVGKTEGASVTSEGTKQAVQDVAGETTSALANHEITCNQEGSGGC